jgi:hypothetical protein
MGLKVLYTDTREEAVKRIKSGLDSTDYKVIKAMESYLVELDRLPLEFKEERDKIRDRINEIRGTE